MASWYCHDVGTESDFPSPGARQDDDPTSTICWVDFPGGEGFSSPPALTETKGKKKLSPLVPWVGDGG